MDYQPEHNPVKGLFTWIIIIGIVILCSYQACNAQDNTKFIGILLQNQLPNEDLYLYDNVGVLKYIDQLNPQSSRCIVIYIERKADDILEYLNKNYLVDMDRWISKDGSYQMSLRFNSNYITLIRQKNLTRL